MKILFLFLLSFSIAHGSDECSKHYDSVNQQIKQNAVDSLGNKQRIENDSLTSFYVEQQTGTNYLAKIRQNTEDTAKNTEKGKYEFWTIFLSALAFITAGVTLVFTICTYKSQKKTQENTTPVFKPEKQFEVLVSITNDLLDCLFEAYAVLYRINHSKSGYIPSELLFPLCHIDSTEIHLELFYNDKKQLYNPSALDCLLNPTNYSKVSHLKDKIEILNEECKTIARQIQEKKYDIETIKQEYSYYLIQQDIFNVLESVEEVLESVYATSMKEYIVKSIFIKMLVKHELITENLNNDSQKHIEFVKQFEDNYTNIKENLLRGFPGIDEVIDRTEEKWKEVFKDFDLSKAIPTLKKFNIDEYLDFVKLMVVGFLTQEFKETPYISY